MARYTLWVLIIVSVLGSILPLESAQADAPPQATVVVSELNVRYEPAIGDNIIGQFTNGTRLDVLGKEDVWNRHAWLYVTDGNLTGWVSFEYVQMDSAYAYKDLPVLLDRSEPLSLPITGHTAINNLSLRVEPSTTADIITMLPDNTPVTVVGHDDIWSNRGIWLEVVVNDESNLQGWVSCRYVIADGVRNMWSGSTCFGVAQVPVTATDGQRTLAEPIAPSGLTMAIWQLEHNRSKLNIRQLPTTDAPVVAQVSPGSVLAVYGTHTEIRRNPQNDWWKRYLWDSTPWFYIIDPFTGNQGWVYFHYYLNFPRSFDLSKLTVIESIENPALPTGIIPASSLEAVVHQSQVTLRATHPETMRRDPLEYLPQGTALNLVGRDTRLDYVYVGVDGLEGWVAIGSLAVEGDPQRLPIFYINSE